LPSCSRVRCRRRLGYRPARSARFVDRLNSPFSQAAESPHPRVAVLFASDPSDVPSPTSSVVRCPVSEIFKASAAHPRVSLRRTRRGGVQKEPVHHLAVAFNSARRKAIMATRAPAKGEPDRCDASIGFRSGGRFASRSVRDHRFDDPTVQHLPGRGRIHQRRHLANRCRLLRRHAVHLAGVRAALCENGTVRFCEGLRVSPIRRLPGLSE
jgi:hypothetical protein